MTPLPESPELVLDHLGIAVRSLAEAAQFYELLGAQALAPELVEHEGVRVSMVPLGAGRVELLEPVAAESAVGRFLASRGEGLHHVAYRVSGAGALEARFAALQAAGVRLVSDTIRTGAGGHRYFFVHPRSAGGVLVELVGD